MVLVGGTFRKDLGLQHGAVMNGIGALIKGLQSPFTKRQRKRMLAMEREVGGGRCLLDGDHPASLISDFQSQNYEQ